MVSNDVELLYSYIADKKVTSKNERITRRLKS